MSGKQEIVSTENLTFGHNSRFIPGTKALKKWTAIASSSAPSYSGEVLFTIGRGSADYLSQLVLRFDVSAWSFSAGVGVVTAGGLSYISQVQLRTSNSNVLATFDRDSILLLSKKFMSSEEVSRFNVACGVTGGTDPLVAQSFYISLSDLWFTPHQSYASSLPLALLANDLVLAVQFYPSASVVDGSPTLTSAGTLSSAILYMETLQAPEAVEEARMVLKNEGKLTYLVEDYIRCPDQAVAAGSTSADVPIDGIATAHVRFILWTQRQAADLTSSLNTTCISFQSYGSFQIGDSAGGVLGTSFYVPRKMELSVLSDDYAAPYSATDIISIASFALDHSGTTSEMNRSSGGLRLHTSPRLQVQYASGLGQADTIYLLACIHSVITIDSQGNISKQAL